MTVEQKNCISRVAEFSIDAKCNIKPEKFLTLFDYIMEIGKAHEKTGALPYYGFEEFVELFGDSNIKFVCKKLNLNELQTVLFSDIFNLYDGSEIGFKNIAEFIGCKPVALMQYMDELKAIEDKELIRMDEYRNQGLCFNIDLEIIDAIKKDSLPDNKDKNFSIDEFFTQIVKLYEKRIQREHNYPKTVKNMNILLRENEHLGLVKTLKTYSLSEDDKLILLYFCHCLVDRDSEELDFDAINPLYDYNTSYFRTSKRELQSGTHILQKKELIQYVYKDGFGDTETFSLTDKAKDELLFELKDQLTKKTIRGITETDTITDKKLFYPEKTADQVAELTNLLKEDNFCSSQKRLSQDGMRTGFACLFSGGPGTGKTETAYQIARLTGRGIMQIDISATKSMWFGESEKKIKKVFTQYRSAVKKMNITPILLFNEADAIIGKRQSLSDDRNGLGQTENTIQNIILQEIENLNGILIATTNLATNMDKAFERRFLYKIEFEAPNIEIRRSIWQTIIPCLSQEQVDTLAVKFDFSGGQIENIARRKTVAEVLYGFPPSLEKLIEYCMEEKQNNSGTKRIGFCV